MTVVPMSVAVLVVGEDSLVIRVLVAGEEVAGARRDVDAVVVDRDAERMTRRGCAREDRDVAERPRSSPTGEPGVPGRQRQRPDHRHDPATHDDGRAGRCVVPCRFMAGPPFG